MPYDKPFFVTMLVHYTKGQWVKCPQNGLFHDLVTIISTSQMAVSEVEIPTQKSWHPFIVRDCLPQPLVVVKITTANDLSWKWWNVVIFIIFHDFDLQKGSLSGNTTLKKTLFDGQINRKKYHDKNDDYGHKMLGFTFEMLMPITSKCYQKFMSELLTAICDR